MKMISKTTGSIVILGVIFGCAGDEGAPPPSAPGGPSADAIAKVKGPAAKPAMGGEMKGPAAGAPDAKKGEDSPKVEGPKGEPGKTSSTDAKLTSDEIAAIQKLPLRNRPSPRRSSFARSASITSGRWASP
jgi:hypothetical protein